MVLFLNLLQTLKDGDIGEGRCLAWNPASGRNGIPLSLAFCGSKSKVPVWDLISPSEIKMRFEGNLCHAASVAWSPCGKLLAATRILDDLTTIFNNEENDLTTILKNQENVAMAMGFLSFYGPRQFEGQRQMIRVSWSASGSLLATYGGKDNSISIWKINIPNIASRPPLVSPFCIYEQIKHGNWASEILGDRLLTSTWRIKPDKEFELVAHLREHAGDVNYVQWHPKRAVLFSCSSDHTVKVWFKTGRLNWRCVETLGEPQNGHISAVWSLAFNASGDKMVTSSDDGTLKIWEVTRTSAHTFLHWNHVYTLTRCHDGAIFSVHWSREGIIATGGADGMIGLFREIGSQELYDQNEQFCFSNNFLSLKTAVAGPLYRLLLKEKKHDQRINSVQWSPGEDRILASTGVDETIKLWKLEQANEEIESNF